MTKHISPHVTIYKFPVTAISSIATRLTGLYMSGLFVAGGIYNLYYKDDVFKKYDKLNDNYKKIINYSLILPSTYHTMGGIRHFIWDKYPSLLTNKSVMRSSYLLFGASIGTSLLIEKSIFKK
tara:strand:+ start:1104 stop:1472 length:369 start_codon:yes stop_codon:yes gene_type:complete